MNVPSELEKWCADNGVVARWHKDIGYVRVQLKVYGLPFVERYTLVEAVEAMKKEIESRVKNGWKFEDLGFHYRW